MIRPVRLLIACICTVLVVSSFDFSSSSSSSLLSHLQLPSIQFADAQIVHEAMSELERARVEASRSGRVRDLSTLANRKRRSREASHSEEALPAPLHVRITEKGEQELYTPDREHHIRTNRHPTASNIPVARRQHHPADPVHDDSGPVLKGYEGSIHVPRSEKARLRRKPLPTKRDHTAPAAAEGPADAAHAAPPAGEKYVQREDSYTLNRAQSANLNTLPMSEEGRVFDQGSLTEQQLSALSALDGGEDHRKPGDGYLASVVDAIIDPHSISVNSSPSSALGIALIVIIPLVAIIVLFFGYSFYIYNKRVALEAKVNSRAQSINAARAAKKKAAGGSPSTSPNTEGAPGGPPSSNASKKTSARSGGAASEEADWEVHYGGRDEEDDL